MRPPATQRPPPSVLSRGVKITLSVSSHRPVNIYSTVKILPIPISDRSILQFQSSLAPRWRLLDVVAMKISVDVETSCLVYRDQDQDRRPGSWSIAVTLATSGQQPAASQSRIVLCSAPSVPQPVVQSRRRPLLGTSPG